MLMGSSNLRWKKKSVALRVIALKSLRELVRNAGPWAPSPVMFVGRVKNLPRSPDVH